VVKRNPPANSTNPQIRLISRFMAMKRYVTWPARLVVVCVGAVASLVVPQASQIRPGASGPEFAAATVKLNRSGARQRSIGFEPGGRFVARNMPVRFVIGRAYGVGTTLPPYLFDGGPEWIENEPYDIEAVPEPGALANLDENGRRDALLAMLRALLTDRFELRAHWEPRERPVYLLVRSRADRRIGPSLVPSAGDDCRPPLTSATATPLPACGAGPMDRGVLSGYNMTLPEITRTLQFYLERPVIDRTDLRGRFTFSLRFALELPGVPVEGDTSIFTALSEQLGLRVQADRQPVDVLVVDAIERPASD
jgi:uncharacterized protein (TIGR03435 family)